jgi:hypothetical protein
VDHVITGLDEGHGEALAHLATSLAEFVGVQASGHCPHPHVTVVAFDGLAANDASDD